MIIDSRSIRKFGPPNDNSILIESYERPSELTRTSSGVFTYDMNNKEIQLQGDFTNIYSVGDKVTFLDRISQDHRINTIITEVTYSSISDETEIVFQVFEIINPTNKFSSNS